MLITNGLLLNIFKWEEFLCCTYLLEVVAHDNSVHTARSEVRQEEAHENRLPGTEHVCNARVV